ncbi:MAG: hypothetical protein LUG98_05420 [Tannerellaceae bacterium]|nr:hypothetical protein [Tannerellaceae bacterium]
MRDLFDTFMWQAERIDYESACAREWEEQDRRETMEALLQELEELADEEVCRRYNVDTRQDGIEGIREYWQ